MKTLAIVGQKGGVGKSTLATALAVEAARNGQKAVVLDLDPQASASFWRDTRTDDDVTVTAIPASRLAHVLKAAGEMGADLAIIDTPPHSRDIAFEAVEQADFVLLPTRPAVLDVMAMSKTVELVRHHKRAFAAVLTFCPSGGREVADTLQVVEKLGAPVCPVRIGQRIAYSRAQQTGRAAQELEPDGKAAQEIRDLYEYVRMNVGTETPMKGKSHGRKRV